MLWSQNLDFHDFQEILGALHFFLEKRTSPPSFWNSIFHKCTYLHPKVSEGCCGDRIIIFLIFSNFWELLHFFRKKTESFLITNNYFPKAYKGCYEAVIWISLITRIFFYFWPIYAGVNLEISLSKSWCFTLHNWLTCYLILIVTPPHYKDTI